MFFGVHAIALTPPLRAVLARPLGELGYQGVFSLFSLGGLVLMTIGYDGQGEPLYASPAWAHAMALPVMLVAFVLLAAAFTNTHIRRITRHPMTLGICLLYTSDAADE